MTPFEKAYHRLFMLRGVDTKHMNDCELVWIAAQREAEEAQRSKSLEGYESYSDYLARMEACRKGVG